MSGDSSNSTCQLVSGNITCDVNETLLHLITGAFIMKSSASIQREKQQGRRTQLQKPTIPTMSLIVPLLVLTLVHQCCSAPQRINWTPQAILYLKGAQGHRSALERSRREDDGASHPVTLAQSSDGRGLSLASSILLELLQRAAEEDEGRTDKYQDDLEQYLTYF